MSNGSIPTSDDTKYNREQFRCKEDMAIDNVEEQDEQLEIANRLVRSAMLRIPARK